jgi:hypothetical protein
MKKLVSFMMVVAFVALTSLSITSVASAADYKIVGVVERIEIGGSSATVTLKDNKTGNRVPVIVTDNLTLDKLRDKRIVVGDEIRSKYDDSTGKNVSKLFRKTAGC